MGETVAVAIWTIMSLLLFTVVFGALYFFKREIGGFDVKQGAWVAPISKMFSSDSPESESDFKEL